MLKNKRFIHLVIASVLIASICSLVAYRFSKAKSPAQPIKVAQPLSHEQFEAVKNKLVQLLEEKDPEASLDYLRNAIAQDASLARECHPLLHHLGQSAYEKYKDFNKTVSYQDGLCNSGYTHGTIEAHFMASNDIHTALQTTCSNQNNEITFQQWQCYHGTGHGVMYFTGKDLSQSLSLCESLPTDFARSSCVNGAFMERFIIVSHSGSPAKSTSNVNTDLCEQQAAVYKSDCYFYAPTAYLERHTNDYNGAFEDCKNAENNFIDSCINGVGGQAMKENITRPDIARDICKTAPKKYVSSCIKGAIVLLINHSGSTALVEPLCDTTFGLYKDICTENIESWNSAYNP